MTTSDERIKAKLEASAGAEESELEVPSIPAAQADDDVQLDADTQADDAQQPPAEPPEEAAAAEDDAPEDDFNFHRVARETGYEVSDDVAPADFLRQQREQWEQSQQELAYLRNAAKQQQAPANSPEPEPTAEETWELEKYVREQVGLPDRDPSWDRMEKQGIVALNPETGFYEPTAGNEYIRGSEALQGLNEYAYKERQFAPMLRIARMNQEIARREAQAAYQQASTQQQHRQVQQQNEVAAAQFRSENADLINDPSKRAVLKEELELLNPNLPAATLLSTAKERTLQRLGIAASPQQPASPQQSSRSPQADTVLQKAAKAAVAQSPATGAPTDQGRAADGSDGVPFEEFWPHRLAGVKV